MDGHPIAECDRRLRQHPRYNPTRCESLPTYVCSCGRVWYHVCDEAGGCFYLEAVAR